MWPAEEAHPQGPGFSQTCTNFSRRISLLLKKAEPRPASKGPQDRGREAPCPAPAGGPACLAGLRGSCMQPASQCHLDRCLGSLWAPPGCPDPGLRLGLEQGRMGCYRPWLNCRNHSATELPSGQPPLAWKHLVGSTRSRYPGRQVSHSVGSLTGSTAVPRGSARDRAGSAALPASAGSRAGGLWLPCRTEGRWAHGLLLLGVGRWGHGIQPGEGPSRRPEAPSIETLVAAAPLLTLPSVTPAPGPPSRTLPQTLGILRTLLASGNPCRPLSPYLFSSKL